MKSFKSRNNKHKFLIMILYMIPIFISIVLLIASFFLLDPKSEFGMTVIVILGSYVVLMGIGYFIFHSAISASMVEYSIKQGMIQSGLLMSLVVPYAILNNKGKIIWANNSFKETIGVSERRKLHGYIDDYILDINLDDVKELEKELAVDVRYDNRHYKAILKKLDLNEYLEAEEGLLIEQEEDNPDKESVVALYLFDITDEMKYKQESYDQKLIAGLLYIDNYDEVMNSMEEVKQPVLATLIDRKINVYLANLDAITKRLENDKYLFVFPQKYIDTAKKNRFSILEDVKKINTGNDIPATLSIGIGAGYDTYINSYEAAKVAIGLALGRGGDQVAVKNGDNVEYFGGKSAGSEKVTRVKARVKAQAFEELLENKDKVLIMAHSRPDPDAFGSAVGLYRLATTLGKKAYIILNEVTESIEPMVKTFSGNVLYSEMIINNEQAQKMVSRSTLLVVSDVNRPSMTECPELLKTVPNIVVFDHHRQSNEPIENATLSYIEPFASSACEMITELFQYISVKPKIRPVEADAIYMGILIDTNNFLTKTGVRTFEAASYLRNSGADVTRVRKLMRSNLTELKERANAISNTEMFSGYAMSYVDPDPDSEDVPTVAAAKAANALLDAEGVKASFVVTESKDGILYVSARSIGDVNVQLVMERFGGGGHANVAGVQLRDRTRESFFEELKTVLIEMETSGEL